MDEQRKALIETFQSREVDIRKLLHKGVASFQKNAEYAVRFRNAGNELFKKAVHTAREHEDIFRHYCLSVVFAPNDSRELMLAYGNRSAILLHIKKFRDSIKDADRAFAMSDSLVYKIRLLCRKAECLARLGSVAESKAVLTQAKIFLGTFEDQENREQVEGLIGKVEADCKGEKQIDQTADRVSDDDVEMDVTEDLVSRVTLTRDSPYGYGLLAARDFAPGEVIFVEKLFASVPDLRFSHKQCHHCLAYCWSGIPCQHCFVVLYCSEWCRDKAWKVYHESECNVQAELINNGLKDLKYFLAVRLLLMGLKEDKGVEKLKETLKYVDGKGDKCTFAMKDNDTFDTRFLSIYDTPGECQTSRQELAFYAISCLVFLAKKTNIFQTRVLKGFKKFSESEEVLYLGSLLLKIIEVAEVNARFIYDMLHSNCNRGKWCCRRGSYISPLSGLIHQSCYANTSRCFVKNNKLVIFALHPIKKNDMLFDCHCSPFFWQSKADRVASLQSIHMTCKCQACAEDWPPILLNRQQAVLELPATTSSNVEVNQIAANRQILLNCGLDENIYISKEMSILSETIMMTFNNSTPPSRITCLLVYGMQSSFLSKYGLKADKPFEVPCT